MYRVKQTIILAEKVHELWIRAPQITKIVQAGQFAILRIGEYVKRILITISAVKKNCIHFIFTNSGKTTEQFNACKQMNSIREVLGSLGKSSEIAKYGTCTIARGGWVL